MLKKSFKLVLWMLFAITVAASSVAWWFIRGPQANGSGQLILPGLKTEITITRNEQGIPHIQASTADDAYFGLGFAHAQDRLWQMMFHRRIAQGRLSEILGDATVETDKFLRTLGVYHRAQAAKAEYDPASLATMQRYADGVNAFLATRSGPLPIEFTMIQAPAPEPWKVEDSIAWSIMMAWDLGANWRRELRRFNYAKTWSLDKINDLMMPYAGETPLKTIDYSALYRELGVFATTQTVANAASFLIANAPESGLEGIGSNNWVISGKHTESGKPLLANDPHLSLGTPSLWYLASLQAGDWQAVGATIPAMPAVVLGRNTQIAWGFTNTGPDVQDTYLERINPQNPAQYQTPTGWEEFTLREERIRIKGKPDLVLTTRATRHGPVISDVYVAAGMPALKTNLAPNYVLAFQWTALMKGDLSASAGFGMAKAQNWDEFKLAVRGFHAPQQNIVYADVTGNIGYIAAGRIPVRKANNDLHGLAPALGWDSKYDWDGWLAFEALPTQFNPPSGFIATANEKINRAGDPFLTSEWALPYRAKRISELLQASPKHSLATAKAMQTDIKSLAVLDFLKLATPLLETHPWRDRLTQFDGYMRVDSATALVASAWWRQLTRRLFIDDLGEKAYLEAADVSMLWQPMLAALEGKSKIDWCDDNRTPEKESCSSQVNAALKDALTELQTRYGEESKWQWGKAHSLQAEHNPLSKIPTLAPAFGSTMPLPGDAFTVMQLKNSFGKEAAPYAAFHGPGYRGFFDMSQPIAHVIQSTGQSGLMSHPNYKDLLSSWSRGESIAMPLGKQADISAQRANQRWVLKPQ